MCEHTAARAVRCVGGGGGSGLGDGQLGLQGHILPQRDNDRSVGVASAQRMPSIKHTMVALESGSRSGVGCSGIDNTCTAVLADDVDGVAYASPLPLVYHIAHMWSCVRNRVVAYGLWCMCRTQPQWAKVLGEHDLHESAVHDPSLVSADGGAVPRWVGLAQGCTCVHASASSRVCFHDSMCLVLLA